MNVLEHNVDNLRCAVLKELGGRSTQPYANPVALVFKPVVAGSLRMGVVSVVDKKGADIPVVKLTTPITLAEEKYIPYYMQLRLGQAELPFTVKLTMTKPRTFQFTSPAKHILK